MMTWLYPNCLDDVMDRRSYDSYDRLTALNNWLSELELWLWLCLCHLTFTMTMMMAMEAIRLDLANGSIHSVQSLTLLMGLLSYLENSFMWSSKGYVCKARLRKFDMSWVASMTSTRWQVWPGYSLEILWTYRRADKQEG